MIRGLHGTGAQVAVRPGQRPQVDDGEFKTLLEHTACT